MAAACRVLLLFFLGGLGEELILWNRHLNEIALRNLECRLLARDAISVKHLLKWHATAFERGRLVGGLLLRVERLLHRYHIVIVGKRRIADLICRGRHRLVGPVLLAARPHHHSILMLLVRHRHVLAWVVVIDEVIVRLTRDHLLQILRWHLA